jgi:DNA-binding transcriptional ArsR family regulator
MKVAIALRALANERRLLILDWLRDPKKHFREQVDGDLVDDGVCGVLIAEQLGVSAPTLSEHMRVLIEAKLLRAKRVKQWTMYKRDEDAIASVKRVIREKV